MQLIGARTAEETTRQEVVRVLMDVLRTDQSSARDVKVAALIALGLVKMQTFVADPVQPADGEKPEPVQAHDSRTALIDAVLEYFEDEDNEFLVRAHAPVTLARLIEGLPDGPEQDDLYDVYKQKVADVLLKRFGKHSKEPDEVLQSSATALGLIGDNDADKVDAAIRKSLFDNPHKDQQIEYFTYVAVAHAAGEMGKGDDPAGKSLEETRKYLLKELTKGRKPESRAWVGLSIGVLGAMLNDAGEGGRLGMTSELRAELAGAKNPSEVGAYAIAAGILQDEDSIPILIEKLRKSGDDEARGYICVGLGLMNASKAIPAIEEIIEKSKYRPVLLQQAAIALGMMGDKQLVDKLIDMLLDAESLSTQASISSALGFIGDSRSIDPLVDMLEDESITEVARGFAAAALGIVADKEDLPWNSKIGVDLNYRASVQTLNDQEGKGILNIL